MNVTHSDIVHLMWLCFVGGSQRNAVEVLNTEFTFELFVCAAILHDYRGKLLECQDSAGVFQFVMNG